MVKTSMNSAFILKTKVNVIATTMCPNMFKSEVSKKKLTKLVMIMKALGILVLAIGFVQAEQEKEQSKNIIRILFECTKNPDSSDLCWRLNEAFPNLEFPENHLNDPLGLDPPPQENLDLSTFVDEFEQRTKLPTEGMDEETIHYMYELYKSMSDLIPITQKCLNILIKT